MKKYITAILILIGLVSLLNSCSKTWSGVKQDTNQAWKGTKKVVHDATA